MEANLRGVFIVDVYSLAKIWLHFMILSHFKEDTGLETSLGNCPY